MQLVHTGNNLSYLSDLVTTIANIPSRIRLRWARTVMNHWQLSWCLANAVFPTLGKIKNGTASPIQFRKLTDSNILKRTFLFENAFYTMIVYCRWSLLRRVGQLPLQNICSLFCSFHQPPIGYISAGTNPSEAPRRTSSFPPIFWRLFVFLLTL